ncbi:unnamed protein product [Amoebophrya sp. A25]|nr:unnamed protein product [Amoebophrya sp. A25]|eukprot:GSA25T00024796001.1
MTTAAQKEDNSWWDQSSGSASSGSEDTHTTSSTSKNPEKTCSRPAAGLHRNDDGSWSCTGVSDDDTNFMLRLTRQFAVTIAVTNAGAFYGWRKFVNSRNLDVIPRRAGYLSIPFVSLQLASCFFACTYLRPEETRERMQRIAVQIQEAAAELQNERRQAIGGKGQGQHQSRELFRVPSDLNSILQSSGPLDLSQHNTSMGINSLAAHMSPQGPALGQAVAASQGHTTLRPNVDVMNHVDVMNFSSDVEIMGEDSCQTAMG